jgi:rhodanese-related sulfurtransferase
MMAFLMGVPTLSPADLHRLTREGCTRVFDLNAPAQWRQAHVPGAVNLAPGDFDPSALPADKETPIVFYCSNPFCRKAPNAAVRARKLGHADVRVMSAGIQGWLGERLPVESAPAN